ncbi:hypothetical protein Kpho02_50120 [Kitasatospora phosalacinea]|uniref:Uncharacterized protein n=1 Tax=Kitasatospora phosalacinea TaxID=2065 RepID=A0A9W6QD48_9ACTN|nr:hypothetical protein [Kitasatospora phosalacinea]GLW72713.1 hypothetical protein Kpho02_50120 [Kitasatospora phosalacinea]
MAYRYRCGECGFKTSWGTESQGERAQIAHYADRHPDLYPGGTVETNGKDPSGGIGCLGVLAVLFLLFVLAVSCSR